MSLTSLIPVQNLSMLVKEKGRFEGLTQSMCSYLRGRGGGTGSWGRKSQFTLLHETLAMDKSGSEH